MRLDQRLVLTWVGFIFTVQHIFQMFCGIFFFFLFFLFCLSFFFFFFLFFNHDLKMIFLWKWDQSNANRCRNRYRKKELLSTTRSNQSLLKSNPVLLFSFFLFIFFLKHYFFSFSFFFHSPFFSFSFTFFFFNFFFHFFSFSFQIFFFKNNPIEAPSRDVNQNLMMFDKELNTPEAPTIYSLKALGKFYIFWWTLGFYLYLWSTFLKMLMATL